MPEAIPVHVMLVVDESGSMQPVRDDLIGGVNKFFADQRAVPGKCRLTLVKFAPFTIVHDAIKIADVPDLTRQTYAPNSNTPLLDAEGKAIQLGRVREMARAANNKRTEAVLFVTYTDGQENASIEFSWDTLTALKKEREEAKWTFLYLGAGHDAYAQARQMGGRVQNTSSVLRTSGGIKHSNQAMSDVTTAYRSAANVGDTATLAGAVMDAYVTLGVDKADKADKADDDVEDATS